MSRIDHSNIIDIICISALLLKLIILKWDVIYVGIMLDCSQKGIIWESRIQIEMLSSYRDFDFWLDSLKKLEQGTMQDQKGENDISYSEYRLKKGKFNAFHFISNFLLFSKLIWIT